VAVGTTTGIAPGGNILNVDSTELECLRVLRFLSRGAGWQPLFEHGSFAATETAYCRHTWQALVRAAEAHMSQGEDVKP
jgi:hypothetical protein